LWQSTELLLKFHRRLAPVVLHLMLWQQIQVFHHYYQYYLTVEILSGRNFRGNPQELLYQPVKDRDRIQYPAQNRPDSEPERSQLL